MNVFIEHIYRGQGARASDKTLTRVVEATGEEPEARGTSSWAGQRASPETVNSQAGQSQVPMGLRTEARVGTSLPCAPKV